VSRFDVRLTAFLQETMFTSSDTASRGGHRPGAPHAAEPGRRVAVQAPGRLHLGFLDPGASLGRRYGSLGLVIEDFETTLTLEPADHDEIDAGPAPGELPRLQHHLATLRQVSGCRQPLRVRLESVLPAHCGLGSGTQLALAIGQGFAQLFDLPWTTRDVAQSLGRGLRSGVGIAGFDHGGFIVDGGPAHADDVAPLLARLGFPDAWRVVVVEDEQQCGLHGSEEVQALARLPAFPREAAADLCHHVLMKLLPALAEAQFESFAHSLSHIQRRIGAYFAPAQGGSMYTSPAVARLMQWVERSGLPAGLGQSSWGPTAFAFMPSAAAAQRLVDQARAAGMLAPPLSLRIVQGRNRGATLQAMPMSKTL
jgi:beta-RFAP synthase